MGALGPSERILYLDDLLSNPGRIRRLTHNTGKVPLSARALLFRESRGLRFRTGRYMYRRICRAEAIGVLRELYPRRGLVANSEADRAAPTSAHWGLDYRLYSYRILFLPLFWHRG